MYDRKAKRIRNKELGLCKNCSQPVYVDRNGKKITVCEKCKLVASNNRQRKKLNNICAECNKPNDTYNTRCKKCSLKIKEYMIKKRQQRKDEGKCIRCGKTLIDVGVDVIKTKCVNCTEYKFIW